MLKISIVTPSYNQAKFIEECLQSVKRQNHSAVEHIVVDGGSKDSTVEILKRCSSQPGWGHLKWISEPDRGQSDALNKGFQMARGDVIGWLNADDFYLPGCFEPVMRAYQRRPKTDVLYGDYLWTDMEGKPFQIRREIAFSKFVLLHNHVVYICSTAALFFSRRIIQDGYLLNEAYHYAMDYEYFVRLSIAGYRFHHVPVLLGALRLHSESKTGAQAHKQIEEQEKARRENLARMGQLNGLSGSRLGLTFLRCLANGRRWGEKALRGHYFTQFRPTSIK